MMKFLEDGTLEYTAGDTVRFKVLVEDPDPASPDPSNPVMIPRDMTGWGAAAQIRKTAKASEVLAAFVVTSPGSDGFIELHLPPAQSDLTRGNSKAVWDLQLTDLDGDVDTIFGGDIHIIPDVTRV